MSRPSDEVRVASRVVEYTRADGVRMTRTEHGIEVFGVLIPCNVKALDVDSLLYELRYAVDQAFCEREEDKTTNRRMT